MATNPPNQSGKYNGGPHVTKQGKSGPILSSHSLSQGSNGSSRSKVAPTKVGASPSKAKGGWYMGSKKKS
jgi:hypothetical protein